MIYLYDTMKRKKVELKTVEDHVVKMYVCGPTVYNRIHIGNARTFICFDVIRRYLEWSGYKVIFVQNITDVDDKIIAKANELGIESSEVAKRYTKFFQDDMASVGVMPPSIQPKATEEISTMIELIDELVKKGYAYTSDEGDVYFSVRSFNSYGRLSGRNIDEMEAGHRGLRSEGIEDRKRDPLDFALWKTAKEGEPSWGSPWSEGRPGWHIECSCMSKKYLGLPFDIHGGGADLVFPHHENERAQSEAATGLDFANYWMHSGMLRINGEKMSKSADNFFLLCDILDEVDPQDLRFFLMQTHYRSPLDFSDEGIAEAHVALSRIRNFEQTLSWAIEHTSDTADVLDPDALDKLSAKAKTCFSEAMDDDFNSPRAIGVLFDFLSEVNTLISHTTINKTDAARLASIYRFFEETLEIFGISFKASADGNEQIPEEVQKLVNTREEARKAKDWSLADEARDKLAQLGYSVKDTPQGPLIQKN